MAGKPLIIITGDAQAQALALALSRTPSVTAAHDVLFEDPRNPGAVSAADAGRCAFWLSQNGTSPPKHKMPRSCVRLTFPRLHLRMLWPLAAANPYGSAAPGQPLPPFPWADSFILASVARGVGEEETLGYFTAPVWNSSWPNLDALFTEETSALLAADAKCDVKIGSFVLKHFRKRRLFWAPNAPADELVVELAYRLLHACFGRKTPAEREHIAAALAEISAAGVMSHVEVPVHPLVARHFDLEWYEAGRQYSTPEGKRDFAEYYRDMIRYFTAERAQASGVSHEASSRR